MNWQEQRRQLALVESGDGGSDVTLEEDQGCFLSVPESYGVVVSLLFLFKTSRGRQRRLRITVSSAQVTSSRGRWGREGRAGMRALHGPALHLSKNKKKYHMGHSDR